MKIVPFSKAPNNCVFRIFKERGRPEPEKGLFVKISNSRSRSFSKAKDIILNLGDMVEIVQRSEDGHRNKTV